jgi:hypothetical protein
MNVHDAAEAFRKHDPGLRKTAQQIERNMSPSPVERACRRVRELVAGTGRWRYRNAEDTAREVYGYPEESHWPSVTAEEPRPSHLLDVLPDDEAVNVEIGQLAALAPTLRDLLCGRANKTGVLEILDGARYCAMCGRTYQDKPRHAPDCQMPALLRRAAEELGGGA